jgi:hypothetical protein
VAADGDRPAVPAWEQALRIAEWIHGSGEDGNGGPNSAFPGPYWLRQPPSFSDREWILAIAESYRGLAKHAEMAASS